MNGIFLKSFLLIFGQNKYANLKKCWTIICQKKQKKTTKKTKTDSNHLKVVKITALSAMGIKLW